MRRTAEHDRAVLAPDDDGDSPTQPIVRMPVSAPQAAVEPTTSSRRQGATRHDTAMGHRLDGRNESRPPRWLVPTIVCLALLVAGLGGFVVARASQIPGGNTKVGHVSGATTTTTGPQVTTAPSVPVAAPSTAPAPVPATKLEKNQGCGPAGARTTTAVGPLSICHHRHGHG
jgi:hypothetical protein